WWLVALVGCAGTHPVAPEVARAPTAERDVAASSSSAPSVTEAPSYGAWAAAGGSAPAPADRDGDVVVFPCLPDTDRHREAAARLDGLRKILDDLAGTDDPSRANEALAKVLAHPCF